METNILKSQQMLQGNSSLPINEGDKSVQGNSKHMPFNPNTYPNAENIRPPLQQEGRRVVEPATRTEISINAHKSLQERVDMIREQLREKNDIIYSKVGGQIIPRAEMTQQGSVVDIEV